MATQKTNLFASLRNLTEAVGHYKSAAGNPPDPGSIGGATSHPVANLDNGCTKTTTGSRASEYESDIKQDQGAPGVDSVSELSVGNEQDSVQMNIGMTSKATGEDPAVEDAYKGGKDDPGSESAARTDNSSLDGKKYAKHTFADMRKAASDVSNLVMADIINGFFPTKAAEDTASGTAAADSAATTDAAPTGEKMPEKPDTETTSGEGVFAEPGAEKSAGEYSRLLKQATEAIAGKQATASGMSPEMEAGYKLAAQLGLSVKEAQLQVANTMESTITDALLDADLVGGYLVTVKRAMESASGEDHDEEDDDSSSGANASDGAGGAPNHGSTSGSGGGDAQPSGQGSDHAEPDADNDPLAGLLGGGGGSGGEGGGGDGGGGMPSLDGAGAPPAGGGSLGDILGGGSDPGGMMPPAGGDPAMGGAPPMGGADPAMGGAPPMGGDPAAGGMGGGGQEEAIAQLVAALQELGISPEELSQSGPPPAQPGEMSEGMKLASVAKKFMRSGKYQVKEAGAKTAARQMRDKFKQHLLELCAK